MCHFDEDLTRQSRVDGPQEVTLVPPSRLNWKIIHLNNRKPSISEKCVEFQHNLMIVGMHSQTLLILFIAS